METVRLAFVDVPHLLSIALLAHESALEVDAFKLGRHRVSEAVAAGEVGVLVAGPRLADPDEICRLLMSYPPLKALVVIDDGRQAEVFELRPNRETRELSSEMLVDVAKASLRSCAEQLGEPRWHRDEERKPP